MTPFWSLSGRLLAARHPGNVQLRLVEARGIEYLGGHEPCLTAEIHQEPGTKTTPRTQDTGQQRRWATDCPQQRGMHQCRASLCTTQRAMQACFTALPVFPDPMRSSLHAYSENGYRIMHQGSAPQTPNAVPTSHEHVKASI